MTPNTLHLQLHLFEPAKDANALPPEIRRRLLALIITLLEEAADLAEPEAVQAAVMMEADNE